MHKFIAKVFFVLFVTVACIPKFVHAEEVESTKGQYQKVIDFHGLRKVDKAPSGVVPLDVDSPDELDKIVRSLKETTVIQAETVSVDAENATTAGTVYSTITRQCGVGVGGATVYTVASIRVGSYNSSYRWIEAVSPRVTWSGYTFGNVLTNTWTNTPTITDNGTRTHVAGGGTVEVYLRTPVGDILVMSTPVECSFDYSVY